MSSKQKTDDTSIPPPIMLDPLGLLNAHMHDLILTGLETALGQSRDTFSSLYLARSRFVFAETKGSRSSLHAILHVKDQDHADDAAQLSLMFAVDLVENEKEIT